MRMGLNVFKFTQSQHFYNEPCVRFVEAMKAGKLWHANDPVLEWQAANLEFTRNNRGLVMPDKSKREFKIDGMVASLMAFSVSACSLRNKCEAASTSQTLWRSASDPPRLNHLDRICRHRLRSRCGRLRVLSDPPRGGVPVGRRVGGCRRRVGGCSGDSLATHTEG
jgi:hypothetical protein